MTQTTFATSSGIGALNANFNEVYSLLELWKFTAAGAYSGYTGASYKLELGGAGTRNVLAFNVAAFGWGSAVYAIDVGSLTAVEDESTIASRFSCNTYYDNTNRKAKATGSSGILRIGSGSLSYLCAPSVTAGSNQTFVEHFRTTLADGNFLIGCTVEPVSAGRRLNVQAAAGNTIAASLVNNPSTSATQVLDLWNQKTSGDNGFIAFLTEGSVTARGSIDFNRGGTAVRYNTTSDRRLKANIRDFAAETWRILRGALPRTYEWRETGATAHGYIAQVLHRLYPDAVKRGGRTTPWMVDNSKMVPVLHAGVVDVMDEVQELRRMVGKLTREVERLKAKR